LKETIHIACAADNAYVQHSSVMLCSLFENNKNNQVQIHFFSADFSDTNLKIIESLVLKYDQKFIYYKLNESIFKDCYISNHVSYATYYRIVIPKIVVSITPKILYLDTDVIICEDLLPLWQINLEDKTIAAANEPSLSNNQRLAIPANCNYFNAGILLINVSAWVKNDISSTLFKYIKKHKSSLTFWDQDALNANLYKSRLELSPIWNQQSAFFELGKYELLKIYSKSELEVAIKSPRIIHFTGSSKPWNFLNFHPLKNQYYNYLKLTIFNGYEPKATIGVKLKYLFITVFGIKFYKSLFSLLVK
jgi:lipopolysaccharide biosynthesis glycosyltransferase